MTDVPALYRRLLRCKELIELHDARQAAESDLMAFVKLFWHVTDPEEPLVTGWPLEAICDHLMAVTAGHVLRLIMNVPPGFSKSLTSDVFWPAWEWGPRRLSHMRYIAASYTASLTERDNLRFLRVINDPLYRKLWGDVFQTELTGVTRISNDKTGWKLATSVGGMGTGERGNRVIIDDANNPKDVESDPVRDGTNLWLREVMPDRLNNLREGAIINIQQRTHEADATGTLVEHGRGYTWLMIPMEYDPRRHCMTVLKRDADGEPVETWEDPRGLDDDGELLTGLRDDGTIRPNSPMAQAEGELAWPERFPPEVVSEQAAIKGPFAYAGQYQQAPTARGGGILRSEWWRPWTAPEFPDFGTVIVSLDTASTEREENDESALTKFGAFGDANGRPQIMLRDAWEGFLEFDALLARALEMCRAAPAATVLLVEGKANGIAAIQELRRRFARSGMAIIQIDPVGDKVNRALAVQPMWSGRYSKDPLTGLESWGGGVMWAPDRDWADLVIERCASFPKGRRKGLVDTVTQAAKWIRDNGVVLHRDEWDLERHDEKLFRPVPQVAYDV